MDRSASLQEQLNGVSDPRRGESVYPLTNILFMTICAVIAGADDFVAIAKFANTKKEWFAKYLDISAGVPSHDRFNAITAIPELLKIIEVSGGLVTIDAMDCQTEIADRIIEEKADYCLAVKGNQPALHDVIKAFFLKQLETDFADVDVREYQSEEKGHGREDLRSYMTDWVAIARKSMSTAMYLFPFFLVATKRFLATL